MHILSWHCGHPSSWDFSCRCPEDIAMLLFIQFQVAHWEGLEILLSGVADLAKNTSPLGSIVFFVL